MTTLTAFNSLLITTHEPARNYIEALAVLGAVLQCPYGTLFSTTHKMALLSMILRIAQRRVSNNQAPSYRVQIAALLL